MASDSHEIGLSRDPSHRMLSLLLRASQQTPQPRPANGESGLIAAWAQLVAATELSPLL